MAITYYCKDSNSVDVSDGSSFNKEMDVNTSTNVVHAKNNIGGGASNEVTHTYTNTAGVPGLTSWASGNYDSYVYCSSIGADVSFTIALCRIDSTGTLVSTLGTSSSHSTTGLKTFTHNLASPLTVNSGDRLQIRILASRAANHGNQNLAIDVFNASGFSRLETPFTVVANISRLMLSGVGQ